MFRLVIRDLREWNLYRNKCEEKYLMERLKQIILCVSSGIKVMYSFILVCALKLRAFDLCVDEKLFP